MPAPYNTLPTNSTGNLYDIFKFLAVDSTGGLFGPIVLGTLWMILFIGSLVEGKQASRAFIFAGFVSALLATMLSLIGVLAPMYMYFMFLMVGIGVIWFKLDNAPGI